MGLKFLPTELYIFTFSLVGLGALFSIIKYRNDMKTVVAALSSGISCILEATRKLLISKQYIYENLITLIQVFIIILLIISVISLGINFIEKTRNKPELRRKAKILIMYFLIESRVFGD